MFTKNIFQIRKSFRLKIYFILEIIEAEPRFKSISNLCILRMIKWLDLSYSTLGGAKHFSVLQSPRSSNHQQRVRNLTILKMTGILPCCPFCRYFSNEGVSGGVSYENINMDQITSLCGEGFTKVEQFMKFLEITNNICIFQPAVVRALLISRNDVTLARDILQVRWRFSFKGELKTKMKKVLHFLFNQDSWWNKFQLSNPKA